MSFSADDFLRAYPADKREFDSNFVLLSRVGRWCFYPSRWLMSLGVAANQVTYASYIAILAGGALLAMGSRVSMVLGVLAMLLYQLLDCVDGVIARHMQQRSAHGAYLDTMGSHVATALIWVGIAVGQLVHPDAWNPSFFGLGEKWVIACGFGAALFSSLADVAAYVGELLESERAELQSAETSVGESGRTARDKLLLVRNNVTSCGGIVLPLLLVAAAAGVSSLILFVYFWVHLLDALLQICRHAWRALRLDSARMKD